MFVTDHARYRLEGRLGLPWADRLIAALERLAGEMGNVAIEVATLPEVGYADDGSNGDRVVVIARDGSVETVMLRRSWNQPFTPAALSVHRCTRLNVA